VTSTSWSERSIRELGERPSYAGAEIEQHDLVEDVQQREQLAVGVRAEPARDERVSRGREQVQAARERRDVAAQLRCRH